MCILPLISPHVYLLIQQKKFIQKVEIDHLVNLAYADIVERMYRNTLPWNDVISGRSFEMDQSYLRTLSYSKQLPYKGSYKFTEKKHKGKDPYTLYLFGLDFIFVPIEKKAVKEGEEIPGTLKYHYDLFVKRDLGAGELPSGTAEDEEGVEQVGEGEEQMPNGEGE